MNCYTVKMYVSVASEGERDAVVELNSPGASCVACYHISEDGTTTQVPDVRLTTTLENTARQVLQSLLELERPARAWRGAAAAPERRNQAA